MNHSHNYIKNLEIVSFEMNLYRAVKMVEFKRHITLDYSDPVKKRFEDKINWIKNNDPERYERFLIEKEDYDRLFPIMQFMNMMNRGDE